MNVEARVTIEPTLHSGMLVTVVVVHDEMKLFVLMRRSIKRRSATIPGGCVGACTRRSRCRQEC